MKKKSSEKHSSKIGRITSWIVGIVFLIIVISVFFSGKAPNDANQATNQKSTNLKLEDLSAEEVLDRYVSNFNYNGLSDRIEKLKVEKELATGYALESLETDIDFLDKVELAIFDYETICKEAETLTGQKSCVEFLKNLRAYRTIKRDFKVLSKEVIDLDSNKASIKLKHEMVFGDSSSVNKTTGETTYLLKKEERIWKIYDFIFEDGKFLSKSGDIEKRKSENDKTIQSLRETYGKIASLVNEIKNTINLQNKIKSINNVRDVKILLTNTSLTVVQITAIYDPSLTDSLAALGDDYIGMLDESSRIFKQVFPLSYEINEATIVFYKTEKDVYGDPTDKLLGKVTLSRSEYNKINWNGFSSKNLEKIGKVQFYGKSSIKELEDLQKQLEEQRAMAEAYARSIFG